MSIRKIFHFRKCVSSHQKQVLFLGFIMVLVGIKDSQAEPDTATHLKFSGFADLYYSYDFSTPESRVKPNFLYNHKRLNELNANLLLARGAYSDSNTRASFGLMAGNYAQYNLRGESTWAQFVYEANIGVKLSKKKDIWLDVGILPSHIGFESAISSDCWTLTRSLLAENSPYYETGAKVTSANVNKDFSFAFLVLNGWQYINKPVGIHLPSVGIQIQKTISNKLLLNYSNFYGFTVPNNRTTLRDFHNFYVQYDDKKRFGFILGFDVGSEHTKSTLDGRWYSPVIILRQRVGPKLWVAVRGEQYNDADNIIVQEKIKRGFDVSGLSTNFDFSINEKVQWRMEFKIYHSAKDIFVNNKHESYTITSNLTFKI